jgi:protein-disulfide isomerase
VSPLVPILTRLPLAIGVAFGLGCGSPPPPTTGGEIDLGDEAATPTLAPPMCMETESTSCGSAAPEKPDAPVADTVWRVPIGPDDPVRGRADAPVTVVVFSDFECPYCRRAASSLEALLGKHPDTVRIVWKDLPLPVHHRSEAAALFARGVRAQLGDDGFWKAHDLLFERQPAFSDEELAEMAGKLGARWDDILASMKARTHAGTLLRSEHLADAVEIRSTPTTFVNGRKVVGARALDALDDLVDEELAKARKLLAEGVAPSALYDRIVDEGRQIEGTSDLP